jgi:hypothetical protein
VLPARVAIGAQRERSQHRAIHRRLPRSRLRGGRAEQEEQESEYEYWHVPKLRANERDQRTRACFVTRSRARWHRVRPFLRTITTHRAPRTGEARATTPRGREGSTTHRARHEQEEAQHIARATNRRKHNTSRAPRTGGAQRLARHEREQAQHIPRATNGRKHNTSRAPRHGRKHNTSRATAREEERRIARATNGRKHDVPHAANRRRHDAPAA